MKMNYSYNEMKRAFECGRNFQLTGENNFQELIEELNQALPQADVSGRSEQLLAFAIWLDDATIAGLLAEPEYYVKRYLSQ